MTVPRAGSISTASPAQESGAICSLYAVLLALSAFVLLPICWMLTVALKPDNTPVFTVPPQWFPTEHFEWQNFVHVLTDPMRPFLRYIFNTLFIFGANIVGTLFSCTLVAYRLRPAALPRQRPALQRADHHHADALAGDDDSPVPAVSPLGWYGTYLPLIVPSVHRQRLLHLPHPPVHAHLPARARRRRQDRRRRATSAPSGTSSCRSAPPVLVVVVVLHVPRHLGRSAGAADLPQRQRSVHAGHRAGQSGHAGRSEHGTC